MYDVMQGYAPIRQDYEDFYTRRMYYRIHVRPHATAFVQLWSKILLRQTVLRDHSLSHSPHDCACCLGRIAGTGQLLVRQMLG